MSPALLYGDRQYVVGFSVIPKCVTLNDLEWLFGVKFCFCAGLACSDFATVEKNNCTKNDIDTHCQQCKSSAGTLVSGNVWFVRIFGQIL